MRELRYTLVSDGSSDKALLSILSWLLRECRPNWLVHPEWADLRRLPRPPRELEDRIAQAMDLYPCDLLFVHRDGEGQPRELRVKEIHSAFANATQRRGAPHPPVVCAVTVRMLEAWLLIDEGAIRWAAGNPKGRAVLNLPSTRVLEDLADPKERLHGLLAVASELAGRRLKKLNVHVAIHRIAEGIDDFSPLRALPAFVALEQELNASLTTLESNGR